VFNSDDLSFGGVQAALERSPEGSYSCFSHAVSACFRNFAVRSWSPSPRTSASLVYTSLEPGNQEEDGDSAAA
jgi:hypothetical protein